MFHSMKEIVGLLDEADEARTLAMGTTDPESVQDLLKYAAALEAEAARLDRLWAEESNPDRSKGSYRSPMTVSPS